MNRRVLFVDDEPHVLEGLRHRMHRQRHQWDMVFVGSGEAALDVLAREPFDAIVSDLRMPRMDGATLLQHVRDRHPQVVRIVLSGQAEMEIALGAANVAHQFLAKPSEAGTIENVVDRACRLQLLISDDRIRRIVGRVEHLPSMPRVYAQLKAALLNDHVSADQLASILKRDMAICAKTLQLVNSAFFRLARPIVEIEEAVSYLGFTTIQRIAFAVEIFQQRRGAKGPQRLAVEAIQDHATVVAQVASVLVTDRQTGEDAFVAGLLHDIGKLLLVVELPDHIEQVRLEMRRSGASMYEAEMTTTGVSHAEVGAYLLGLWGLPFPVIEAVGNHHTPWKVDSRDVGMLAATYIANGLVHDQVDARAPDHERSCLDQAYIESLGVTGQIAGWRDMVVSVVAEHATGRL